MKNIVIAGGANGMGQKIAQKFLTSDWNPIILDIASNNSSSFPYYQCDVSLHNQTQECIDAIVKKFHTIDALVNCIRYRPKLKKAECNAEDWQKGIDVDLNTYFNTCSTVCEMMKDLKGECSIVNISSVLSECVTLSEPLSYHASKAAINQLTRYLAVKYGPHGIRVNTVSPGLISNERAEPYSNSEAASPYSRLAKHIPLRRTGSPEEIADLILFLVGPSSSFITGQNIVIDGGLMIREQLCSASDV